MAIYRLLAQSSFDPEDISRMTAAYEECLRLLKLANRADPITELVAKHIIEVARTGERDPSKICALTLERISISCKIWYSISQTVSDLGNIHDRSIRAFAVKPRAFGAPLSGFGA